MGIDWLRASALTGMLTLTFTLFLGPLPALAHTTSLVYGITWDASDRTVDWSFTSGDWPSTAHKDRVRDGAAQWNAQGQSMTYQGVAEYAPFSHKCADPVTLRPYQKDGMHWLSAGDGNGGTLALTTKCIYPGTAILHDIQILFDKDEARLYTGTGPIQPGQKDLWSIATHEFGHGTGFGKPAPFSHFDGTGQGETCPFPLKDIDEETMCGSYPVDTGDIYPRDLSDHDIHTFGAVY